MKHILFELVHRRVALEIPAILISAILLAHSAQAHLTTLPPSSSQTPHSRVPATVVNEIKSGYFRKAYDSLEPKMLDHADDADFEYRYAQSLLGVGKDRDALSAIKKAVSLAPRKASYYRFMGQVYGALAENANIFHALGLAKDVLSAFKMAVMRAPHDPKSLADLATYYIDAPGIVGGNRNKAHKIEDTLQKLDPLYALRVKAHEAVEDHHFKTAETLLRQAIKLDDTPHSAQTLAFLYMRRHRYRKEFELFITITRQRPADIRAWYWVGRASILSRSHYAVGIHALTHYITATERPDNAPSLAFAHLRLGDLYLLTGKTHSACLEFAQAKRSNGSNKNHFKRDLGKSLKRLRALHARNIGPITSRKDFSKADCT